MLPHTTSEMYLPNDGTHIYVIQATVARKSWPLSTNQWSYVEKLKQQEKDDIKAFLGGYDKNH